MLDSNDKKYIKEIVNKTLKKISSSKYKGDSEFDSYYRNKLEKRWQRIDKLTQLYENGEETLSELLELKKLLKEQKKDEETPRWKQKSKYVINKGVENIKESSVAKDSLKALLYTNPITALMYQNKDLFKGLGNIAKGSASFVGNSIYQLLKGKRYLKQNYTGTSLIPTEKQERLETRGSTNYIAAKNVYLQGGTNYLNVYLDKMPISNQGRFNQKALPNNQLLLEDSKYEDYTEKSDIIWQQESARPKGVKEDKKPSKMLLGIKALEKSLEAGNKILSVMKTRQFLILGAILLGVAGIVGLATWLNNKFGNKGEQDKKIRIGKENTLNTLQHYGDKNKLADYNKVLGKGKITSLNVEENYGDKDVAEMYNKIGKQNNKYTFSTDTNKFEGDWSQKTHVVRAPFDGKLTQQPRFEQNGSWTLIGELTEKFGDLFKIYGLVDVTYFKKNAQFKKGQPLGIAYDSLFAIETTGWSKSQAEEYMNFVNADVEASNNQLYYDTMSIDDKILSKQRQEMENVNNKNKPSYWEKRDAMLHGLIHGGDTGNPDIKFRWQKENDEVGRYENDKPTNNYNVANKNVENAKSSETKTSTPRIQPTTQPTPQPIQKQNIDIPSPKSNIQVGFIDGLDAIVASSNNLTINTMTV